MEKIAILIPTRGLVYSRVLEAIENERQGYATKLYISSNLPIPEGHNYLTEKALGDGMEYFLFIEEDTIPPAGTFEKLLATAKEADIACIDYGIAGWGCVTRNTLGDILWCGLGCTLVKREVFESLEKPYFRADMVLDLPDFKWRQLPEDYIKTKNYGSLDIWFCIKAREKGFVIKQTEGEATHLELKELGKKGINNGIHNIQERPGITKKQIL